MDSLTDNAQIFWDFVKFSAVTQFFLWSLAILAIGLCYEIWSRSVRMTFVEKMSLQFVERRHPHLPSLRVIVVLFICMLTLLVVALQTITGLTPLDHPSEWIILGAFFTIVATAGILAETKWRGVSDDAFAFIIGTSLAFLFVVFRYTVTDPNHILWSACLFGLLLFCIGLSWAMLFRQWTHRLRIITFTVFMLWIIFLSSR